MDKQEASRAIALHCEQMRALYNECISIAKQGGVPFDLPWGGDGVLAEDGRGAGATFYPAGVENYNKWDTDRAQWVSSSATC